MLRLSVLLSSICAGVTRTSVIYMADTHVGEGCNSSDHNYQLNDTNCYSVRDLKRAVAYINAQNVQQHFALAIIGGDLTSSAQPTEFIAAKRELDALQMPYLPTLGNHDIWSYNQVVGDLTPTPEGDRLFAATFSGPSILCIVPMLRSFVYRYICGILRTWRLRLQ